MGRGGERRLGNRMGLKRSNRGKGGNDVRVTGWG